MNRADHFRAGLRKTDIDSVRDKFAFASNQHAAQDWYRGRIVKNDAGEYTVKTENKLADGRRDPFAGQCKR
jgi:hypothetical protein